MNRIYISPIFDLNYYQFYLKGIYDYYSRDYKIEFSFTEPYIDFIKYADTPYRKDHFYYEIHSNGCKRRVVIAADDNTSISPDIYDKVDVYAKVNLEGNSIKEKVKLMPIGPSFGIKYISVFKYISLAVEFYSRGIKNPYISTYFKQSLKRCTLDEYEKVDNPLNNYVFYLNYPWGKHKELTDLRKDIILKLQKLHIDGIIHFAGGFSKRRLGYYKGLKPISANKLFSHKLYLQHIKRSEIVINTPAVHGCFGWKLGEYFALGKAIISLPYNRIFPGNGEHAKAIYYVNSIDQLSDAICFLKNNPSERRKLEKAALHYFNEWLSPVRVIQRIHNRAFADISSI